MIVLWLLVAHLTGDYLLQTRWQAAGKFGWTEDACLLRLRHVSAYLLPFIPVAVVYVNRPDTLVAAFAAGTFLLWLGILHFLTDAQRFTRTPGEWFLWRVRSSPASSSSSPSGFSSPSSLGSRLSENPWPPISLAIDQTLHLIQIALLTEVFLR